MKPNEAKQLGDLSTSKPWRRELNTKLETPRPVLLFSPLRKSECTATGFLAARTETQASGPGGPY